MIRLLRTSLRLVDQCEGEPGPRDLAQSWAVDHIVEVYLGGQGELEGFDESGVDEIALERVRLHRQGHIEVLVGD